MKNSALKKLVFGFAALSATTLSVPSYADSGFYIGAGVSQSFVDESGLDENDTGGKIFGGYKFNDYVAIEGAYYDFGEISENSSSLEFDGVSLAVVGSIPVSTNLSLLGKVGGHDWDAEATGSIASRLNTDSDSDVFYGIGVEYDFSNNLSLRGEVERYEVDQLDVDVATVSISFNF